MMRFASCGSRVGGRRSSVSVCLNNNSLVDPRVRRFGRLIKPIELLEELVLEVRRLLDALFQLLEGRPRHVADSDVVRGDGLCGNQRVGCTGSVER